jgi:hypothetical protein
MTEEQVREVFARVVEMDKDNEGRPDYVIIPCELSFVMMRYVNEPKSPDLLLLLAEEHRPKSDPPPAPDGMVFAHMAALACALESSSQTDEPFILPQQFAFAFLWILFNPCAAWAAHGWIVAQD